MSTINQMKKFTGIALLFGIFLQSCAGGNVDLGMKSQESANYHKKFSRDTRGYENSDIGPHILNRSQAQALKASFNERGMYDSANEITLALTKPTISTISTPSGDIKVNGIKASTRLLGGGKEDKDKLLTAIGTHRNLMENDNLVDGLITAIDDLEENKIGVIENEFIADFSDATLGFLQIDINMQMDNNKKQWDDFMQNVSKTIEHELVIKEKEGSEYRSVSEVNEVYAPYDFNGAYKVGACIEYKKKSYRCKKDTNDPVGTWDPTYWEERSGGNCIII